MKMLDQGKQRGFSLIELSVVLVILGMIMSLGVKLLPQVTERVKLTDSAVSLRQYKEIIIGFAINNSRLPCPDGNFDPEGYDGLEDCEGVFGADKVTMTGRLPYRDLGLSSPAVDSSHVEIRYSVFRMFDTAIPEGMGLGAVLPGSPEPTRRKINDLAGVHDISSVEARQINGQYFTFHPIPVLVNSTVLAAMGSGYTSFDTNRNYFSCPDDKSCGPDNDTLTLNAGDLDQLNTIERSDFCQTLTNADNESNAMHDGNTASLNYPNSQESVFTREYRNNTAHFPDPSYTSASTAYDISQYPSDPYKAEGCSDTLEPYEKINPYAFILISSGVGDADGDGDLFDGENAISPADFFDGTNSSLKINCFESPARGRSQDYDDIVLAVSFSELRAHLCQ